MRKKVKVNEIFFVLIAAFILRIFLSFFGTLELDFNTFLGWSNSLESNGFRSFYSSWSDYLPGYLYILWLLGKLKPLASLIPETLWFKLPAILGDLGMGYLIYWIVKTKRKKKTALLASCLYLFNPAVFANSTLWGQVDGLTTLFSMLSVWLASTNWVLSALVLGFGVSIKPQVGLAALVVLFLAFRDKWKISKLIYYTLVSLAFFGLTFIPFSNTINLPLFVYQRVMVTLNQYPYSSVNAFNFWGFFGFWIKDTGRVISPSLIGVVITLVWFLILVWKLRKVKVSEYLLLSVLFLFNFFFFSRMHERHLLPALGPLVVVGSIMPVLWLLYFALSLTYLANLYYSFVWITNDFKEVFNDFVIKIIILINFSVLTFLVWVGVSKKFRKRLRKVSLLKKIKLDILVKDKERLNFKPVKMSKKFHNLILGAILLFALVSRLLFINSPEEKYFDEVYHAFTAQIMLEGDPKAWEWWNPHPEGFAYEWTHPPLAKEGMVLGMAIFGKNAIGWRIPGAILGAGSVFLVYLIARSLFKDRLLSLISAFVFALDGLPLVMSRIGMNDSYLLFFVLLSIYLYIRKKNLPSAIAFGLALSTKWSAVWMLPILFVAHFTLRRKIQISYLWFIVIPPLVYLISYIPMFLTGHDFDIFIGVQKQMWWYHTRLEADHPFTSMWYTWPFLIRPIWIYTSGVIEGKVSNIYAMGNPVIFWSGLVAIITSLYYTFVTKSKKLALVVFSYLVFFVPWAASPRIMFLYHYLPSIPFLAIALGFVLRKNLKIATPLLVVAFLVFLYFYPHWTGIEVTRNFDKSYYWFKSWR